MKSERTILMNPGPVTLTDGVRDALVNGDWCHREPEFADLTREINDRLVRVYRETTGKYASVMLTGSGTSAVEAMLASFAPHDSTTLVIANGVYGERIANILKVHGRPHTVVRSEWGEPMDMAAVRAEVEAGSIRNVVAVHHETTTGRLNDLTELGELCKQHDVNMLLDAVSSFGAESILVDDWNVAAMAATATKCLHGVAGISFVLARNDMWTDGLVEAGSVYLDLAAYYKGQHGEGYSPFTQAVQPAFALRQALQELEDNGGWEQRRSFYRRRAGRIAVVLKELGLETMLPPQEYSCVLWSWLLPEGLSYKKVHAELKQAGFVIYAGQGHFSQKIFRLAHMGDIRDDDMDRLEIALRSCFGKGA
jgi:2-aminoethylphosphonate-pyruvate transaminase